MNIQFFTVNGYGHRERTYYMGVNAYFDPRQTNIPHETPNYGPGKSNFEVDYYQQTYCSLERVSHIIKN